MTNLEILSDAQSELLAGGNFIFPVWSSKGASASNEINIIGNQYQAGSAGAVNTAGSGLGGFFWPGLSVAGAGEADANNHQHQSLHQDVKIGIANLAW